jgi:hypothetical protein
MKKVKLQFMVVPELLASMAYVPNPVRIKVIDPEAIFLTGLLGESGKKLVEAGVEFYFEKPLAEKLIQKGIAIEVKENTNGCSCVNVPMKELLIALEKLSENQKQRLRDAKII